MLITLKNFDTDKQVSIETEDHKEVVAAIAWIDEPNLFNEVDVSVDSNPFSDVFIKNDAINGKGQPSTLYSFMSALDAIGVIREEK